MGHGWCQWDMSYMENSYQYVIRSGDKEYTLLQKTPRRR